jgi:hypothetical protein
VEIEKISLTLFVKAGHYKRSPKLECQTLILKNTTKTKSSDKENNEGCLPQTLSFQSLA